MVECLALGVVGSSLTGGTALYPCPLFVTGSTQEDPSDMAEKLLTGAYRINTNKQTNKQTIAQTTYMYLSRYTGHLHL